MLFDPPASSQPADQTSFKYIQEEKMKDVSTKPRLFQRANSQNAPKTFSTLPDRKSTLKSDFSPPPPATSSGSNSSRRSNALSMEYRENRPWTQNSYNPDYWSLYDTNQRYDDLYQTERLWREGRVTKGYYPISPRWAPQKKTLADTPLLTARPVLPLHVTNHTDLVRNTVRTPRTPTRRYHNPRWSSHSYEGYRTKFA